MKSYFLQFGAKIAEYFVLVGGGIFAAGQPATIPVASVHKTDIDSIFTPSTYIPALTVLYRTFAYPLSGLT